MDDGKRRWVMVSDASQNRLVDYLGVQAPSDAERRWMTLSDMR